jgi:hypothetical protein
MLPLESKNTTSVVGLDAAESFRKIEKPWWFGDIFCRTTELYVGTGLFGMFM